MVLVFSWAYAARDLLPIRDKPGWDAQTARRAPPLARYDSGWYLGIAEKGYGPAKPRGEASAHAFLPLYPALVSVAARLFRVDGFAAGIGVSAACFFCAGLLFAAEGRRRLTEKGAIAALALLLLFPTSFFLVSMYSESLFLLLALLSFDRLRRGQIFVALLFGFLAGLTRFAALAMALPLAIEAWKVTRRPGVPARAGRRAAVAAFLCGLAPAAGVALWIIAAGWITGEPGLVFRVQEAWQRGTSPLEGLARFATGAVSVARGQVWQHPTLVLDYAYTLLFAAIAVFQARRGRYGDAAWTAGAILLPVSTGIAASLPRYLLVVYPAFYALAEFFDGRPKLRVLWWALSAALLLAGEAAFVHWRWVA